MVRQWKSVCVTYVHLPSYLDLTLGVSLCILLQETPFLIIQVNCTITFKLATESSLLTMSASVKSSTQSRILLLG